MMSARIRNKVIWGSKGMKVVRKIVENRQSYL